MSKKPIKIYLTGNVEQAKEFVINGRLKKANECPGAAQIRLAGNIGPNDEVVVEFPITERQDGAEVQPFPGMEELRTATPERLLELGMRKWSKINGGKTLWLFPVEWFDSLPSGTFVTDIFGQNVAFIRGTSSRESRFGMLAFGIVRDEE